jgi:nucleoid-associated protein YgaU
MFRLGYSLAAKSVDGPNFRVQTIGRQVGVDPFGRTDPKAATVIWGNQFFNGQAALNIPDMQMIFPALSTQATIFLRAIATDAAQGENRVWLDAVCMEPRSEIPAVDVSKYLPPSPQPPTPSPSSATYTIQSGDTLSAIARKFGVTVDALVQANNIANPSLIKPGQILKIPKSN